jgi:glycerol-3-phosphate O-acyltransferase
MDIKAGVSVLVHELESRGARLYLPRSDWDYAVSAGLRMLTLRHLVDERDGMYTARPDEEPLLRYYANSIEHLLAPIAVSQSS